MSFNPYFFKTLLRQGLLLPVFAMFLSACGQSGALYLPQDAKSKSQQQSNDDKAEQTSSVKINASEALAPRAELTETSQTASQTEEE